jgi:RNA polymerase sigma-54 factor
MSQQMVLSPQLQQSLALLQAPVLELKAMVEQELQQNPMLEETAIADITQEERESRADDTFAELDPAEPPADTQFDPATEKPSAEPVDRLDAELQKLLQLDAEWRDHFAATNTINRTTPEDEERRQFMFDSLTAETSLQAELLEQVRDSDLDERLRLIAELLIGNIDDYGYLQSGLEELSFSTGIALADLEAALKAVQTFHPPGVGARDLRECLLLQLERAGRQESHEYEIVRDHMESLGKRRYPEIARQLGITPAEAQRLAGIIAHLDPRPGRIYASESNQYILPEVTVKGNNDEGPVIFRPHDISNAEALIYKLGSADKGTRSVDRLSLFLLSKFSEKAWIQLFGESAASSHHDLSPDLDEESLVRERLRLHRESREPAQQDGSAPRNESSGGDNQKARVLAEEFNRIIQFQEIHDKERFSGVALSEEAMGLLGQQLSGKALVRRRRILLEDAYSPDIATRRETYSVSTENDHIPHLRISNHYKDLLTQAETSGEVREYIREKIKAGKFLIKSIHQRQSTILNIANEIVKRQRNFFAYGVAHLRPMTMVQIAEVVGVHETTVSRAVSGKYMATPQGLFEMKYFFTSGVATDTGGSVSNTSVKTILAELVANEDKSNPLSDEEFVLKLKEKGIVLARRTVAKYRAELNVLPSHLRRQY